ncbi:MAG: preprotein translocase subunit SecY [Chloroflexi bacterium]|nr:MAG: preprotein translocase subunit SecY [Chloroflexota bacterium]
MIQALGQAIRIPELRRKLLFTLMLLLIFRVLASISVPGANPQALQQLFANNSLLGLLNLFSGGGLSTFSVAAMGMNPYINATIIMQLMTVVSLRLKELSKEGEQGRKRITRYTRWLTVALAALQAYGYTVLFTSQGVLSSPSAGTVLSIIITLTAGSIILMWLGELITEYGVGNGVSLVIFSGIIGRLPGALYTYGTTGGTGHILQLIVMAVVAISVTAFIIEVQQAQRKIPIQSAQRVVNPRAGQATQGRRSFLPLRVNAGGVIPIIFAISIMAFPTIFSNFFRNSGGVAGRVASWVTTNWQPNGPSFLSNIAYNGIEFMLVLGFTYFYTAVVFDPNDVADDFKKRSVYIPGIRPGKWTADYLGKVMGRITLAGALFLAVITVVLPLGTSLATGVSTTSLYLGGTAILIVVGVALDTMQQIETQLLMRQYKGFIK